MTSVAPLMPRVRCVRSDAAPSPASAVTRLSLTREDVRRVVTMSTDKIIDELQLINNIRAHECLYNNKIHDYKNVHKRKAAWEDISANLGVPISECKDKWNHLRNAFLHALTRRNGSSTRIFRKWKYENEMSFMLSFLSHGTWNRLFSHTDEDNDPDDDFSVSQYSDECSNEETTAEIGFKRKVQYLEDIIKEKRQRVEEDEEEYDNNVCNETEKTDSYNEILQLVKDRIKNRKEKKDEIDLLFESLAKAVKLLPKSEQIELKVGITSLVYEAQLKHGN